MKNVKQVLPKGQKELIVKALTAFKAALSAFSPENDEAGWMSFDLTSLIAFMDYDISVTLPKSHVEKFAKLHGVDFPEYTGDAHYPVEVDEWVTLITGTISFTDDNVHQRSASIQHIDTFQRHLSSQIEEVIDKAEEEGLDYLVVEEYDGSIEFDIVPAVKDTRVYQLIDTAIDETSKQTFDDLVDAGIDFHVADKLGVGDSYEVHTNEMFVLRIK